MGPDLKDLWPLGKRGGSMRDTDEDTKLNRRVQDTVIKDRLLSNLL